MNTRNMIAGIVLLSANLVVAPVQASDRHHDLWPLYGLTGLVLYDAHSNHHQNKHRYYDDDWGHHNNKRRRHHSYGHKHHRYWNKHRSHGHRSHRRKCR